MLATMTSELQKHHYGMKAYDMYLHLRQLYQGQARHERFQISKALFSCKLSVGNTVGLHVLKMIGYVETLEKLRFSLRQELATDLILQSLPEIKGKKKKLKKFGNKGKGKTKPKSTSSNLKPKGGVEKDSICHHCGKKSLWRRNCKDNLASKKNKEGDASASGTEEK
ncbi:unnamed protein product [Cuscuta campestris]|uniref:CCHC-type domain-containing protein n=1 Tax=Cuscuta campestris TaxID=132261 RepID=A0A484NAK0_9ASTE|nr:unnamed protein product [Cuscuta campestris]